jgi:hypothetical protein
VFTKTKYRRSRRVRRGQSMVEFALVLPLLLLITGGVLEVGNLLTLYNRVSLAAREGARFLATGGDAEDVVQVIEQSSAGSLYFDEEHTCIYVIHAQVNSSGTDWDSWTDPVDQQVYPDPMTTLCQADPGYAPTDPDYQPGGVYPSVVLQQIRDAAGSDADLAGLQLVVVAMRYNADTLLSLPIYPQLQGRVPIQAFTVMRLEAAVEEAAGKPTDGCHAYPIAIKSNATSLDDRSLYEAYQDEVFDLARYTGDDTENNLYTYLLWNDSSALTDAACGAPVGNYDAILAESLSPPGNSLPSQSPSGHCSFDDACEAGPPGSDTAMHIGDCALINGLPGNQALNEMGLHICPNPPDCDENERALRVIVWDEHTSNPGAGYVEIKGFVIIRPIDIDTVTPHSYLTFKLLRWDHSCGQS